MSAHAGSTERQGILGRGIVGAGARAVVASTSASRVWPPDWPPDEVPLPVGSRFCRGMFSCTLHAWPLMVTLSGA